MGLFGRLFGPPDRDGFARIMTRELRALGAARGAAKVRVAAPGDAGGGQEGGRLRRGAPDPPAARARAGVPRGPAADDATGRDGAGPDDDPAAQRPPDPRAGARLPRR